MARGRHHIVDAVGDQQAHGGQAPQPPGPRPRGPAERRQARRDQQPGRDAHGRLHQKGFPQQAEHRGRLAEVRDIRAVVEAETEVVREVVGRQETKRREQGQEAGSVAEPRACQESRGDDGQQEDGQERRTRRSTLAKQARPKNQPTANAQRVA